MAFLGAPWGLAYLTIKFCIEYTLLSNNRHIKQSHFAQKRKNIKKCMFWGVKRHFWGPKGPLAHLTMKFHIVLGPEIKNTHYTVIIST